MQNQQDYNHLSLQDLQLSKKIGNGLTSEVFLARSNSNRKFAVKLYKKSPDYRHNIQNEIFTFENLAPHPNIISCYRTNQEYLILELMSNGELYDYIEAANRKFPETLARYYFKQIVMAINHMHSNNYIHKDLKLQNLLLCDNFKLKLGDFGITKKVNNINESLKEFNGTDGYMSPQVVAHQSYNGVKNDIFALGVLLFTFVMGFPPIYTNANSKDPYYKYFYSGQEADFWKNLSKKINKNLTDDFSNLINGMLCYNEEQRFTVQQILSSKWVSLEIMSDSDRIDTMTQLKKYIM